MRQDSRAAFDEFVLAHGDALTGLAYVLGGERGQAEDATQEALTRLYLRWGRIEEPLPYARRCVVNACRDQGRRSRRREQRERLAAQLQPPAPPIWVDAQVAERDRPSWLTAGRPHCGVVVMAGRPYPPTRAAG